uniref:Uncharacterized protein n=1 Tax=Myotis myotis TaxID=51298 RepID=A0A7J7Z4V1_MYOMY|nr:hypothetical protein mMyoMyo1_010669 [Myotis myotis]
MYPKGLHSGIKCEFPIASTFTYKTNKANTNVHTKNKIHLLQDRQTTRPETVTQGCHAFIAPQVFLNPPELDLIQALSLAQPTRNQTHTRTETIFPTTLYPKREKKHSLKWPLGPTRRVKQVHLLWRQARQRSLPRNRSLVQWRRR